jgi:hypothetical protein
MKKDGYLEDDERYPIGKLKGLIVNQIQQAKSQEEKKDEPIFLHFLSEKKKKAYYDLDPDDREKINKNLEHKYFYSEDQVLKLMEVALTNKILEETEKVKKPYFGIPEETEDWNGHMWKNIGTLKSKEMTKEELESLKKNTERLNEITKSLSDIQKKKEEEVNFRYGQVVRYKNPGSQYNDMIGRVRGGSNSKHDGRKTLVELIDKKVTINVPDQYLEKLTDFQETRDKVINMWADQAAAIDKWGEEKLKKEEEKIDYRDLSQTSGENPCAEVTEDISNKRWWETPTPRVSSVKFFEEKKKESPYATKTFFGVDSDKEWEEIKHLVPITVSRTDWENATERYKKEKAIKAGTDRLAEGYASIGKADYPKQNQYYTYPQVKDEEVSKNNKNPYDNWWDETIENLRKKKQREDELESELIRLRNNLKAKKEIEIKIKGDNLSAIKIIDKLKKENDVLKKKLELLEKDPEAYQKIKILDPYNEENWD